MTIPTLHNYQRFAAEFVKNRKFSGLYLDMGLGKATDDNTLIPTPHGQKRVGDVVVGDQLFDRKGQPTTVTAIYPHKNKRAFKVTLKDGRSFICCDEHLIPYFAYSQAKRIKVKPLSEMINSYKTTKFQNGRESTKYNYRIPQNEAVEYPEQNHHIHPYVLGVLIGDGMLKECSLAMSSNEPDVVYKAADLMNIPRENVKKRPNTYTWAFTKHANLKPIQKELVRLGLRHTGSYTKFIPEEYLYDSKENRIELLKGLLDTDGCVNISHKGSLHYSYSTMNKQLANQIRTLCLSLGFGVNVNEYVYDGKLHDISVRIFTSETIVSSKKQTAKVAQGTYKSTYDRMTPIVDIQEVEPRDMTCFTVDNEEHLYLINDYIVTHNTLITLTALSELGQAGAIRGHILVIAPKKIAVNTWPSEVLKWDHTKNARFKVLAGIPKKKRDQLLETIYTDPPSFYFVNPELIPSLVKDLGANWPFQNIVIDEVQTFKSYNSQRFKAIQKIRPQVDRVIALTGTPAPNSLMDLWPQITLLDGGNRLGKNITAFRETYFNPGRRTPQGYPYEWWIKAGHEDIIYEKISDIVISMKSADYLEMPKLTFNNVVVEMSPAEEKVYAQLKKDHVLPLLDGNEITSANAATLSAQLLQLANGAIYTDPDTKDIAVLHERKLDAMEQIIDSSQGQPLLVFYWFKHDMKRLQARFGDEIEIFDGSPEHLAKWNRGEIPVLLCHPASAGFGLNFQEGGHIIVWFGLPNHNLGLYLQSNARLFRQGQKHPVIIHHIVTKDTVDAKVLASLSEKEDNQNELIDAVKAELGI